MALAVTPAPARAKPKQKPPPPPTIRTTGNEFGGGRRDQIHDDIAQIRAMHRVQVRLHREEQRVIVKALKLGERGRAGLTLEELEGLRTGLQMLTSAALQARLEAIDVFLARITRGALHAARAQEVTVAGADDVQLRATLREEFLRAAHTFTEEDWTLLEEVRMAQQLEGQKAASIVSATGLKKLLRGAKERSADEDTDTEED